VLCSHMSGAKHVRSAKPLAASQPLINRLMNKGTSAVANDHSSIPITPSTVVHDSTIVNDSTSRTVITAGDAEEGIVHNDVVSVDPSCVRKSQKTPYFAAEQVTKAEVLWCLKSIASHYSYNSSSDMKEIMCQMFPDSAICKNISIGATK
jgi:hypothetical protein